MTRTDRAWQVLDGVPDPEVPALSVRDLGIVRDVIDHGEELEVVLTPTYSGCPATEVIEHNVLCAIEAGGLGPARATLRRAPAWTPVRISEEGRRKLREYGIAPPHSVPAQQAGTQAISIFRRKPDSVSCPHCGSLATQQTSAFGSTACKSLYRCLACREPFEYFKPL